MLKMLNNVRNIKRFVLSRIYWYIFSAYTFFKTCGYQYFLTR